MKYKSRVTIAKDICFTWTEDEVLDYLCQLSEKSNVMVESGTYMGASSYAMLSTAPRDAHMWCIDKFMVAGTEHVTRRNLKYWIDRSQCELIVGDSETGGNMLQHMKGKVDLIFIDDGHAEEDVLRDIRCLKPLLRPGGIMVGHDFEIPYNDVARGVLRSGINYTIPIKRLWQHVNT